MENETTGKCEFCGRRGKKRAGPEDGLSENAYACEGCWKLLQNPVTAIPLLRGHNSMELKGVVEPKEAESMVNSFIRGVSPWRPRPPSS